MYSTYTGCPVTSCQNFWIRFLASCRLKNVTSVWVPSAAVANLWKCELWNLRLPVIFSRLHGERIRLTRDIYINVLENKTDSILRKHPLYQDDIRGTTNLLGHPAISVGALKKGPDCVPSQKAAILNTCYEHDTPFEAHTTTSSTTYVCSRAHLSCFHISKSCRSVTVANRFNVGMTLLSRLGSGT